MHVVLEAALISRPVPLEAWIWHETSFTSTPCLRLSRAERWSFGCREDGKMVENRLLAITESSLSDRDVNDADDVTPTRDAFALTTSSMGVVDARDVVCCSWLLPTSTGSSVNSPPAISNFCETGISRLASDPVSLVDLPTKTEIVESPDHERLFKRLRTDTFVAPTEVGNSAVSVPVTNCLQIIRNVMRRVGRNVDFADSEEELRG